MTMRRATAGFTLIELMIALVLGSLLILGLLKVFDASRTSYKLSEGLARVQENSRFAMDYLQRDLRMVGHMGCANDQTRFTENPPKFRTAFVAQQTQSEAQMNAAVELLRFNTMVQGFEAAGTAPGGTATLPASGAWTGSPALPDFVKGLSPAPVAGSDVVVLRYFSAEGIPVRVFDGTSITVDTSRWNAVIASGGNTNPGLLAMSDCLNAVTFEATSVSKGASDTVIRVAASGLNQSSLVNSLLTSGQSMLYRAEVQVYYVGLNRAAADEPTLYRARFTAAPGASTTALVGAEPEALVEGIENMQLIYGTDSQMDQSRRPTGFVARQGVASGVQPGNDTTPWRRVGLAQVAFLARSTERAGVSAALIVEKPRLLGVQITPPDDGRYRTVYESTIAMRNRLYGN